MHRGHRTPRSPLDQTVLVTVGVTVIAQRRSLRDAPSHAVGVLFASVLGPAYGHARLARAPPTLVAQVQEGRTQGVPW